MAIKRKTTNPESQQGPINTNNQVQPPESPKKPPIVPPIQNPVKPPPVPQTDEVVGWLIVHTESVKSKSFAINLNKRLIVGRQEVGYTPDIAINFEGNTDNFFSRIHMEIFSEMDPFQKKVRFYVTDLGTNGKGSTNGTFVNGNAARLNPKFKIEIFDGATIQAGRTKLVLKTSNIVKTVEEATRIVVDSPYTKTVIS